MLIESTVATEGRNIFIIYINTRYVAFKCVFLLFYSKTVFDISKGYMLPQRVRK